MVWGLSYSVTLKDTYAEVSNADSIGHEGTRAPTFTNGWTRGHRE